MEQVRTPEPHFTGPVSLPALLADQPPVRDVGANLDEVRAGRRLVVLDDDPTGTQTIADLPVLTQWSVDDLRWALQQPTTGFFVLTNTRSLLRGRCGGTQSADRRALAEAARLEGDVPYVLLSRSDSTLRGYYPLETDVLSAELARLGTAVDGVVICPAYFEPGRSHGGLGALDAHRRRHDPGRPQRVRQGRQLRLPQLRSAGLGGGEDRRPDLRDLTSRRSR